MTVINAAKAGAVPALASPAVPRAHTSANAMSATSPGGRRQYEKARRRGRAARRTSTPRQQTRHGQWQRGEGDHRPPEWLRARQVCR
jgi:hypothetical protein